MFIGWSRVRSNCCSNLRVGFKEITPGGFRVDGMCDVRESPVMVTALGAAALTVAGCQGAPSHQATQTVTGTSGSAVND